MFFIHSYHYACSQRGDSRRNLIEIVFNYTFFLLFLPYLSNFIVPPLRRKKIGLIFQLLCFFFLLWFKFLFVLCSNKKQNRIASLTAADFRRQNITYCNSSLSIDSFRLHLVECLFAGPFLRSSEVFLLLLRISH